MKYFVLDTETTGLVETWNEITEMSIIRYDDKVQLTKQVRADHPERASLDALRITGKTKYDLAQGISKLELVEICDKFFNSDGLNPNQRCIIAHNAQFDRKFCHFLWTSYGKTFPCDYWVDTMALMRSYNKKMGVKLPVNLQESLKTLSIVKVAGGAHNAKSDTQNTYKLWKKLTEEVKIDYLPHITYHGMEKTSDLSSQEDIYEE